MDWQTWWNLVYAMLFFDFCVFSFVIWREWWRKKGRICIRIKTPIGERIEWRKPEKDGKTIVMQKTKGKKPGWKFTFTRRSLYFIPKWPAFLGRKGLALDVFYDSARAVNYDFQLKTSEMPKWDKITSKAFIEAEILRQRGQGLKLQLPGLFWIILALLMANLVVGILIFQRLLQVF